MTKLSNTKYFIVLSFVISLIILFPPTYPSSYKFLFSDSYFRIRIDVLFLEIVLGFILSYLIYIYLFSSSFSFKFFSLSFFACALFSYLLFLILNPLFSIFSPSFSEINKIEDKLKIKYSLYINNYSVQSFIQSDKYYSPTYLFSKYLFDYYNPGSYYPDAQNTVYNVIDLPKDLLPSIDNYLIDIITDNESRAKLSAERQSYIANKQHNFLVAWAMDGLSNRAKDYFIELPSQYRSHYKIPPGFRVYDSSLAESISKLKYSYVKSSFTDLFSFYETKHNIYLSVTSYYSIVLKIRFFISILIFLSCLIVIFIKRNFLIKYLNRFKY